MGLGCHFPPLPSTFSLWSLTLSPDAAVVIGMILLNEANNMGDASKKRSEFYTEKN